MDEKSSIDVFKLCWDVILEESLNNGMNGIPFNSEHYKILDSVDTNFDILENRLAYIYKFGCYNILFFEKCFMNFLNECPNFETIFPHDKLKVCSLSNGPGFDIIGLLCALCRSNKPKSFSTLHAVNVWYSWLNLYKVLIHKACQIIDSKFPKCILIKQENIGLIEGDIFSTLSSASKKYISDSNVLLMIKTFSSSKTTANKFAKSLRKIFLLLKPGTLIFFIDSGKNMINFYKRPFLNNYVINIFGPQTVILNNVKIDKNSDSIGQKPVGSGSAKFVVWQKRTASDIEELLKTNSKENTKKSKTKKKSVASKKNATDIQLDEAVVANDSNCDSESELSWASGSKLSDVSSSILHYSYSDECNSTSHETKSNISSNSPASPESDNFHSCVNVTSVLDKIDLGHVNNGKHKIDRSQQDLFFPARSVSLLDLTKQTHGGFNTNSLANGASIMKSAHSLNCASFPDLMKTRNPEVPENIAQKHDSLTYTVTISKNTKFLLSAKPMSKENANECSSINEMSSNVMPLINENTDQDNKMTTKNGPGIFMSEKSCENSISEKKDKASQTTAIQKSVENSETQLRNLRPLVQGCENLVTALEKLTVFLKSDIDSLKNHPKCNNFFHTCNNSELSYHCCCRVKTRCACCCQKKL